MKKLSLLLLTLILALCSFGLVACGVSGNNGGENPQNPEHTHNYTSVVTNPTCIAGGYTTYICSCGDSYIDNETNALGHTEQTLQAVEATCTESGLTAGVKCSVCNEILTAQREVEALGHTEQELLAVAPTCTETGLTEGVKCSVCNEILTAQEEVEALGHDIINHEAEEATCTEIGWNAYDTCSRCTYTTYAEIDALAHSEQTLQAVEATCTESGLTAGVKCSVCNKILTAQQEVEATGHSYTSVVTNPTCTQQGYTTHSCNYCDDEYTDTFTQMISHIYVGGYCSACNAPQLYTRVDANGTENAEGQYILFGSYPQTDVTESMGSTLSSYKGTLPTSSNSGTWTSYGYYISGSVSNYMWYKDVTLEGETYRGVYFTSYRPYLTKYSSSASNSYQDNNGYSTSTVYWFKFEPIKWRILSESGGKATLLAEIIIDSQAYQNTYTDSNGYDYATDEQGNILTDGQGNKIYANNYAYSTIREWLNDDFYNTAFSIAEQSIIQTTTVDNGLASTVNEINRYICENTQDKVYLMSVEEMTRTAYGFDIEQFGYNEEREKQNTDYAKVQGGYFMTWYLRSPYYGAGYCARYVGRDGSVDNSDTISCTYCGVVPALQIELS